MISVWRALLRPVIAEERAAAAAVSRALPESVRGPDQGLGTYSTG